MVHLMNEHEKTKKVSSSNDDDFTYHAFGLV